MDPKPNTTTLPPGYLDDVERDLLTHILEGVKQTKLTPENAQTLAKEFLAHLPVTEKKLLLTILNNLGKKFPEAQKVYLDFARPDEEEKTKKTLSDMAELLKKGAIDEALKIAKENREK